jgi:predicted phage tail protein
MTVKVLERKGGVRIEGYGGKSGGAQRTPVESPDDLHSISRAKILDLVSNGEIEGPAHGLEAGLRDVYLDGTPLANANGDLNFPDVTVDFRSGTQDQDYIKGFPSTEVTTGIGIELRSDTPWVRSVTNLELSAVRVTLAVQGLSRVNTENGDIRGHRVNYVVEISTDGGAYVPVVQTSFRGKTTSTYARSHRVDLPDATTGWNIRVRRTTPNEDSATIADSTFVVDFTEVIDAKLRYPMSALVGIQIDAEQFQTIPARAYHLKGRRIRVPSNYNPETRAYTGTWDGTFQTAWSNNPAWVFYDLIVSDLYGLGDVIPSAWIDKWALYPIAQYCDELVPDGKGGQEPRFTTNAYIQSRAQAWKVLQDLASVFRGITYYAGGSVISTADAPRDPVYTYTAANVLGGKFNYTGSSRTARFTVALVSWNDMTDLGRSKVEVVEDRAGIIRYGLRPKEITAFGCTSQGQAQRLGRWLLLTSQLETQGVTFQVGLDGAIAMPGQIIQVADPTRAGRRIGGRVVSAGVDYIVVDAPVVAGPGDEITITLPSGITETRTISAAMGGALTADTDEYTADTTELTADMTGFRSSIVNIFVTEEFSEVPEPETIWALNTEELTTQRFRVTMVSEKEGIAFEIIAVQHLEGKYEAIDSATKIVIPPITIVPPVSQAAPEEVTISSFSVLTQGRTAYAAAIEWPAVEGAVSYEVEWLRDDGDWVPAGRTGATRKEIPNILAGSYLARVRAINSIGVSSLWTVSSLTELDGLIAPPPQVATLTTNSIVFGIEVNWTFPASLNIIERTELYYSTTNNFANAIKLGEFAYPQNTHTLMGLSAGLNLYFWARLIDKNGLPGERFPTGTTGVAGQSSTNAADILGYLTEQITSTQLAAELLSEIEAGGEAAVAVGEVITDLAAMYTIKTQLTVDNRTYVAGIGVGVENDEGEIESQVLVSAERFAVIDPGGDGVTVPFVVQDGSVFINSAFINELSTEVLKATWAQTDELEAGRITSEDGRMVLDFNDVTFTMLKEVP